MADENTMNVNAVNGGDIAAMLQAEHTETTEPEQTGDNELLKLRTETAKLKAAMDKAAKEAAEYKRQLRAKQSAEEIAAEEKRIADEAKDKELEDLRKAFAVAGIEKRVMALGGDSEASSRIAEMLYGANDIEAALGEIQKIWTAREKALRLEYGKIPAPGVGAANAAIDEAIARAREIGKARADSNTKAQEAMKAYMR